MGIHSICFPTMESYSYIFKTCAKRTQVLKGKMFVCLFVCLFDVPVNSNSHVGTLPPFYVTFTQHKDVMTLKMCFINVTFSEIFGLVEVRR